MSTAQYAKDKYQSRILASQCVRCGTSVASGIRECSEHARRTADHAADYRRYNKAQGLCRCGGLKLYGESCETCWFGGIANAHFKTRSFGKQLKALMEAQDYKCAISGVPLTPGINASLDHIVPKSRGGKTSMDNLQWVTRQLNHMKTDMLMDEFVLACFNIVSRLYFDKRDAIE